MSRDQGDQSALRLGSWSLKSGQPWTEGAAHEANCPCVLCVLRSDSGAISGAELADAIEAVAPILQYPGSSYQAEAAEQAEPGPVTIQDALRALRHTIATDARDWGRTPGDAILWAVLVGWGCEEQHEHDEVICGGTGVLQGLAERHRWSPEFVERLQQMRQAVARVEAGDR